MPADSSLPVPPSRAVFLSYAREDTSAARRIADALRSQGVEVWFDQNELRGGDAWDAKIRHQIQKCVLFLAVVSATTQERHEGYFRREWKLAVNRTNDMASGVAFLLPVVIDDTPEKSAEVPEEFLRVQWTRLPGALPTPEFVDLVKRLIAGRPGLGERRADSAPVAVAAPAAPTPAGRGRSSWGWIAAAAVALAVAGGWLALRHPSMPAEASKAVPAAVGGPASVPAQGKSGAPAPALAVNEKSIAVLPFDNRSEDKANAYFADGVQDDILTSLANLHELRVISRTSVLEYRDTTKKIPQIARELGVAYVLEGSVQHSGTTVRITGQLIRAANDDHVWAKSYDRELTATNLFAIQSEIAQAIAGELKAAISPQEKTRIERAPTKNLAAYELFSRAREIFYARGGDIAAMFKEATPLWESAVVLDPDFAEAWAGISAAYSLAYNRGIARTPEAKAKASAAIERARQLAPDNPFVILESARYFSLVETDYKRALEESERAARISPNNADLYSTLVGIYSRQGRGPDALAAARKAYELNPRSDSIARNLAAQLFTAFRYAEAEETYRQAIALNPGSLANSGPLAGLPVWTRGSTREWDTWLAAVPPENRTGATFQSVHFQVTAARGDFTEYARLVESYGREDSPDRRYAFALSLAGQADRARAVATRDRDSQLAIAAREPLNALAWTRLAFAHAILGENAAALAAADKMRSLDPLANEYFSRADVGVLRAEVLAWTGRKDEAIEELGRNWFQPIAAGNRDPLTSFMWTPLQGDPRFEALRSDPRNRQPLY